MDKFVYRVIFQTIIKAIAVTIITVLATILITSIIDVAWHQILLQKYSANFDFWMYSVTFFVCGIITSSFLILCDNIENIDVSAQNIGKRWVKKIEKRHKTLWIKLRLFILPLLILSIICVYIVLSQKEAVIKSFNDYYEVASTGELTNIVEEKLWYFLSIVFAPFFFIKWIHARMLCKRGRCKYCRSAFALVKSANDTYSTTDNVGYETRTYKEEVGAVKVGDSRWMPVYNDYKVKYRIDTEKTTHTNYYVCGYCGKNQTRTHTYVSKQTETEV